MQSVAFRNSFHIIQIFSEICILFRNLALFWRASFFISFDIFYFFERFHHLRCAHCDYGTKFVCWLTANLTPTLREEADHQSRHSQTVPDAQKTNFFREGGGRIWDVTVCPAPPSQPACQPTSLCDLPVLHTTKDCFNSQWVGGRHGLGAAVPARTVLLSGCPATASPRPLLLFSHVFLCTAVFCNRVFGKVQSCPFLQFFVSNFLAFLVFLETEPQAFFQHCRISTPFFT